MVLDLDFRQFDLRGPLTWVGVVALDEEGSIRVVDDGTLGGRIVEDIERTSVDAD